MFLAEHVRPLPRYVLCNGSLRERESGSLPARLLRVLINLMDLLQNTTAVSLMTIILQNTEVFLIGSENGQ
jgi:hypothetical protein